MEERIRSTRSSLAVFVGCCAMSFIGFALITNTSGLYFDAISRDLHVGRAKVSLTVSIRLICSAISMAAFSRFSHRIRLRPTLIGCIGICAVGFLLCSRAYALWQFYLAFAVMGLAYVIPITLMPPILLAAWFPTHFGTVLGITGCLSGLGGAIFNPLISHVIASYGWRSAYLLTGAMLMVLLLPCSYLLKPYPHGKLDTASAPNAKPAHDTRTKSGHLIGMLRSPAFLLLSAAMILLQIVSGINHAYSRVRDFHRTHAYTGRLGGHGPHDWSQRRQTCHRFDAGPCQTAIRNHAVCRHRNHRMVQSAFRSQYGSCDHCKFSGGNRPMPAHDCTSLEHTPRIPGR